MGVEAAPKEAEEFQAAPKEAEEVKAAPKDAEEAKPIVRREQRESILGQGVKAVRINPAIAKGLTDEMKERLDLLSHKAVELGRLADTMRPWNGRGGRGAGRGRSGRTLELPGLNPVTLALPGQAEPKKNAGAGGCQRSGSGRGRGEENPSRRGPAIYVQTDVKPQGKGVGRNHELERGGSKPKESKGLLVEKPLEESCYLAFIFVKFRSESQNS